MVEANGKQKPVTAKNAKFAKKTPQAESDTNWQAPADAGSAFWEA
jgi:hypothetical protein